MKTVKKHFKSSSDVQYKPHRLFCYDDINNVLTGNEMISLCVVFFFLLLLTTNPKAKDLEQADLQKIYDKNL